MKIEVEKDYFDAQLRPNLQEDSALIKEADNSLRLGSKIFDMNLSSFSPEEIDEFYNLVKESDTASKQRRSLMVQLAPIRKVLKNTHETKVTTLKALSMGIIHFLKQDYIDGWLYQIDEENIPHPFLVKKVVMVYPRYDDDRETVEVELVANSAKGESPKELYKKKLSFDIDDYHGKTVPEILAKRGFYKETSELKEMYNEHIRLFQVYQPKYNHQFWIEGTMYSDFKQYSSSKFNMQRDKAVNDEETVTRKFTSHVDASFWRSRGVEEKFDEVPFHSFILLFHLGAHKQVWVHVINMEPYVYNTNLRDKLVLPQTHRDLIDILVEDMDILQDDIIEGKSGGTTILCEGKPGLGKTLSAEVYSEVIQRPLYKVHSGQLGLRADSVQKNLETILKRAARWGAVLLLDEADVYIRSRGDDLEHNAVVASILQTLEYFSGLMFMTTNRGDDVDDAILSRCIAIIKYETPSLEDAKKIWKVLSEQFKVSLSEDMIAELVQKFPNNSGRDIKELLKLSSRFAKGKKIPLSMEVFRQCAQFRGVTIVD